MPGLISDAIDKLSTLHAFWDPDLWKLGHQEIMRSWADQTAPCFDALRARQFRERIEAGTVSYPFQKPPDQPGLQA